MLAYHAGDDGDCFPSIRVLADELAVGQRRVQCYVSELIRQNFIRTQSNFDETGRQRSNNFVFVWNDYLEERMKNTARSPLKNTAPGRASSTTRRGAKDTAPIRIKKEDHHLQEEQKEGNHAVKPPGYSCTPESPMRSLVNSADDDEKSEGERGGDAVIADSTSFPTPEHELQALFEKNGAVLTQKTLRVIREQLEIRSVFFSDYVAEARKRLTCSNVMRSVDAIAIALAKNWASTTRPAVMPDTPPPEKAKCKRCFNAQGNGVVMNATGDGFETCPDCSTVEWIAEFWQREETRRASRQEKSQQSRIKSRDARQSEVLPDKGHGQAMTPGEEATIAALVMIGR